jgi:hypothetical protein
VQDIDVHGRFEKLVVTILVRRAFSSFPGALRGCAYFRHSTAVSRFNSRVQVSRPATTCWSIGMNTQVFTATVTPGLAFFDRLVPFGYPLVRITAGLLLMPHGGGVIGPYPKWIFLD